jgi:hypothetical protein
LLPSASAAAAAAAHATLSSPFSDDHIPNQTIEQAKIQPHERTRRSV